MSIDALRDHRAIPAPIYISRSHLGDIVLSDACLVCAGRYDSRPCKYHRTEPNKVNCIVLSKVLSKVLLSLNPNCTEFLVCLDELIFKRSNKKKLKKPFCKLTMLYLALRIAWPPSPGAHQRGSRLPASFNVVFSYLFSPPLAVFLATERFYSAPSEQKSLLDRKGSRTQSKIAL